MERTSENQQPAQAELDLSQMEPITPKKVVKPEPSFLDKAKNLFGKKETIETPRFYERKEPTFGQPSPVTAAQEPNVTTLPIFDNPPTVQTDIEKVKEMSISTVENDVEQLTESDEIEDTKQDTPVTTAFKTERPFTQRAKPTFTRPENWAIMQKLPEKHRRLFVAIAAGVLVLLALVWLKPSSESAEEIQANQNNSMPIEFQPLDPTITNQASTAVDTSQAAIPAENVTQVNNGVQPTPLSQVNGTQTTLNNANLPSNTGQNNTKSPAQIEREKLAAEQQRKELEKARLEEKVRLEKAQAEKAKAEKLKEEQLAKAKADKAKAEQQAKAAAEKAKNNNGVPVVEAKPAGKPTQSVEVKNTSPTASNKTLTIPKGTSLMQVFRDNNLNISDIGAMNRASGAENVLSSFKPGEKVQVSVNSQGRVNTMRLPNGSTFVRQTDGSYKYNK